MDPEFDTYFVQRLDQVSRPAAGVVPLPQLLRERVGVDVAVLTSGALERARSVADRPLRGDAQLLLYLAFSELVVQPVVAVRGRSLFEPGTELLELANTIGSDMELITRAAARHAEDEPISAHRIIDGASEVWTNLQSGRWGVWDTRPRR